MSGELLDSYQAFLAPSQLQMWTSWSARPDTLEKRQNGRFCKRKKHKITVKFISKVIYYSVLLTSSIIKPWPGCGIFLTWLQLTWPAVQSSRSPGRFPAQWRPADTRWKESSLWQAQGEAACSLPPPSSWPRRPAAPLVKTHASSTKNIYV